MLRSKPSEAKRLLRMLSALLGPAGSSPVSASTQVIYAFRSMLFGAGLADQTIITTLCPGGKERMTRLMRLVETQRINLKPLFTHHFALDDIGKAYELFGSRRDQVLKVAICVSGEGTA